MISDVFRTPASLPAGLQFLAGGGEASRLIVDRDWSNHPLGPPEGWPDILKSTLSTVLNSPESMILAWGREELTFFFNETYFPLLGPRLPWSMGAPFRDVWADAWTQAKPIIDDAFEGKSQRFTDLPWKLATDRGPADTWFTFSYSRILDAEGEVAGLFILTNETTDRVLGDAALRQSEERLRLVIEGAKDHVIVTVDTGGIITSWSAGATAVLGWSGDEAVGQSISMIFTDEDRASGADVRELAGAARDGSATDERWHIKKNGHPVFLSGSMHPLIADVQGHDQGFIKIARDETERQKARQDLERWNATLEQQVAERTADRNRLWQLSSDLMLVASFDGDIEAVNPAWTRILGWSEAELIGVSLFSLIHPEDLDHTITGASGIASGQTYARFENRYRHKNGSYRDIVWAAGPGDEKIIAVGRDSTEERAAAKALTVAEDQLRQAQKMEAVGQLTGGLAHDFNNLLTGMMGNLELLQLRLARGRLDDAERFILAAQGAGRRAASLTQRLLAFSRRQTLDPKATDVNRLIVGMEDLLRRTVGPTNNIEVIGAAGLWTAMIDATQLESAILNLCINARDAMPDGGRLTIETGNKWLDDHAARERDLPAGQYLSICVTDTGTGMTPETIERAFEPFYTTKPIGQGTGLGLSMIYGFARQSNGQVRIYSEVGEGTTICVYLPRYMGEALLPEEEEALAAAASASGETILVVDDEASIRHLIDEVLDEIGYTVIGAADGASGIKVLQSGAKIELLITDVGLPNGMNGRQVADAARTLRPGLKVLFITGYAENAAVGNGHLEPGMELLTKPFTMQALALKVADMMKTTTQRSDRTSTASPRRSDREGSR
ncbi:PAS domain S-box protein [Sphingomonas aurantiaca]|uniref:histidine kinase n=2 Tax=Sphingomonadaceae TaxID=41297 RepID=A0A2T5GJ99_9SPHN|nr:PAS domain S-box protein [Sphingomonas aurantiaca]KQN07009.1 histidine kinase [Sphingomonas sp. Leaf28]PTQ59396.1 PAS domain S-box-containing protein [Sphingomonas aurantiaca]